MLNEMTSSKANYRTAIQTGFSFLWAGIQWLYPYFRPHGPRGPHVEFNAMTNTIVSRSRLRVNRFAQFMFVAVAVALWAT